MLTALFLTDVIGIMLIYMLACHTITCSPAMSSNKANMKTREQSSGIWKTVSSYNAYEPCSGAFYEVVPDPVHGYNGMVIDPSYDSPSVFAKRRYHRNMAREKDLDNAVLYEAEQSNDNAKMNALWSLSDDEGHNAFYDTATRTIYLSKEVNVEMTREKYMSGLLPVLRTSTDGTLHFTRPDYDEHVDLSRDLDEQDAPGDLAFSHLNHVYTRPYHKPPTQECFAKHF